MIWLDYLALVRKTMYDESMDSNFEMNLYNFSEQ